MKERKYRYTELDNLPAISYEFVETLQLLAGHDSLWKTV